MIVIITAFITICNKNKIAQKIVQRSVLEMIIGKRVEFPFYSIPALCGIHIECIQKLINVLVCSKKILTKLFNRKFYWTFFGVRNKAYKLKIQICPGVESDFLAKFVYKISNFRVSNVALVFIFPRLSDFTSKTGQSLRDCMSENCDRQSHNLFLALSQTVLI